MRSKLYAILAIVLTIPFISSAQINIPANGLVVQDFNAIGSSGTATLPANWKMSLAGTGNSSGYATVTNVTATTQAANSGTPTTGGRYNWATTAGTDRAIGFMSDAGYSDTNAIFAYFKNTTGATVTSITVAFSIERYRLNTGSANVALFSSTDGAVWTARTTGDISSAVFAPTASAYSFGSPQTNYKAVTISGLSIANNGDFYLRWVIRTGGNGAASQGIALDDMVLYAATATPVVTSSLRDNLQVDINGPGADAGDQLRYTNVIRNLGSGDATGVNLTDPAPANTTLVPGSVKTSALARNDSYTTAFNTVLNGTTVLTNDFGLPSVTVVSFGSTNSAATAANGVNSTTSDNGGTLVFNTNGTFTYTPPTGFTGIDKFAYIASTGTAPDNAAIVTVTVGSAAGAGTADAYTVAGNIAITTPTSGTGNLLNNDAGSGIAVASVNGNVASVGVPVTTTNGGTLTVSANGSFIYNPPPGYTGADNFTYTIDNGFASPSAAITVTLTINGMIWFIDNNYAGALTDGRLGSPFKTITAFQAVNNNTGNNPANSDNIFVYESATPYNGSITLLTGQKLIGQDASTTLDAISGVTIPLYSATIPATNAVNGTLATLTATNANIVTLSTNNLVRGFTIGNAGTGKKIVGASITTFTLGNNTTPDVILNGTGQALDLTTGALAATSGLISLASTSSANQGISMSGITGNIVFGSTSISGSTTQGILISGSSATIDFGNTTVSAGTDGVSLQNNSSGTRTFGTLGITTTGTFTGFLHSVGGGTTVAGVTNVSNVNGNGIDILNNTQAVTFGGVTVTKSGATGSAINISNTGASGTNVDFGGAILGTSGTRLISPAITINNTGGTNTSTYAFGAVSIYTNGVTAVTATNVDGNINMSSGIIDATGGAAMNINGPAGITNISNITLTTVNSNGGTNNVSLTNCSGSTTNLGNGTLSGASGASFNVTGGTVSCSYTGNITQANNTALVSVNGGHSSGTVIFQTGALSATNGTGLQFDNADGNYTFNGPTTLNGGDAGIDILNGSSGSFAFASGTAITSPSGVALNINGSTCTGTYTGTITHATNTAMISITNHATGIWNFNTGPLNATNGTGIQFDNVDGEYYFNGTTTLNGGDAGVDIINGSAGTVQFSSNTNITNPTGTGFAVVGGTVIVFYNGNISKNNAGALVSISGGHSTNTIRFQSGTLSATNGTGLQFDNADGTYNFNGTNTLNGGDAGIDILNGSGGTFSFSSNTNITNPSGTAFNVDGTVTTITANVTYSGNITQNTASQYMVRINTTGTGTITFNTGTLTTGNTNTTVLGVNLNAVNGNVNFATTNIGLSGSRVTSQPFSITGGIGTYGLGAINIYTSGSTALLATNADGTINSTSGVIDAANGSGVSINGPAGLTTLGMVLTTVNSTGGTNNILLDSCTGTANLGNGALSAAANAAFYINGGNATTTYTGSITKTSAGRLVDIVNRTGNNVTLSGALSSTVSSTGINVSGSTGGGIIDFSNASKVFNTGASAAVTLATNGTSTINFSGGGLNITTTSGTGFNATGGGTVNVTGSNNAIVSTTGTALNVNATTIGSSGLTFLSISVNGASKGITLNTTGSSGTGLIVTGSGTTAGSGGTIQNISARGVEFISSNNISLKNMNFVNANTVDAVASNTGLSLGNNLVENAVIYLATVNTIVLDRINISGTSVEEGINGNAVTNFTLSNSSLVNVGNGPDEDGLHFYNMLGTNNITSTTITSSGDDNVNIQNASGTSTINVTGGSFNTGVLGSGLLFGPRVTTNTTINISGVTCNNNFSGGIVSDCSDGATMVINVSSSTSTNNNDGISISSASGNSQFDLNGNTINNNDFGPINVLKAAFSVGGLFEGRVRNNIIAVANGRTTDGMGLQNLGGGTLKIAVTGNNLDYAGTQRGIYIAGGQDGNAFIEGTVTGNTVDVKLDGTGNAVNGLLAQVAVASPSGDPSNMCMDIGGAGALKNTFTHSLGGTMAGGDIRVRQRFVSVVRLPGYAGGGTDATAAGAYLDARNTIVSPSTVSIATSISGGAACAQPSN